MENLKNIIARYKFALAGHVWLKGGKRNEYIEKIWEMYQESYRAIGAHISSPEGLLAEYDTWEVLLDQSVPVAFFTYKQV
jgi:hypothetical protein